MALAIDPEADITGARPVQEAPNEERRSDGTAPPPVPPSPAPQPAEATAPTTGARAPPTVAAPRGPPSRRRSTSGRSPRRSRRASPPYSAQPSRCAPLRRPFPEWLAPALAMGIRQSWPIVVEAPPGQSEFTWTAETLRLCPIRLHLGSTRLDATPARKAMLASSAHAPFPDGRGAPSDWFDLCGSLRVVYRFGRSWVLVRHGARLHPFVRHRFAVVGDGAASSGAGGGHQRCACSSSSGSDSGREPEHQWLSSINRHGSRKSCRSPRSNRAAGALHQCGACGGNRWGPGERASISPPATPDSGVRSSCWSRSLSVLQRLGVRNAEIDDALQIVLVTADRKFDEIPNRAELKAYICAVCVNVARDVGFGVVSVERLRECALLDDARGRTAVARTPTRRTSSNVNKRWRWSSVFSRIMLPE